MRIRRLWPGLVATILSFGTQPGYSQEVALNRKAASEAAALTEYMGRRIAQTMHYSGAEWLTRDNREQEERCSLLLTNLGVKRGMTICDMGCGNGFYTVQLA
jgi:hypothetical protein